MSDLMNMSRYECRSDCYQLEILWEINEQWKKSEFYPISNAWGRNRRIEWKFAFLLSRATQKTAHVERKQEKETSKGLSFSFQTHAWKWNRWKQRDKVCRAFNTDGQHKSAILTVSMPPMGARSCEGSLHERTRRITRASTSAVPSNFRITARKGWQHSPSRQLIAGCIRSAFRLRR